ncbi:MAG: IS21 family transposase, partial [Burkholderiaceae bacterium]|nr:IS21 family transposase [Burkholderiaceae bacterium]
MFQYRQVLVRMRQGDSDRDIARSRLMGRRKAAALRRVVQARGWLDPATPLPDDAALAAVLGTPARAPTCVSTLEPLRPLIAAWFAERVQATTIHAALVERHGFKGSYSAVRRFVRALAAAQPAQCTTTRLDFAPAEAAQVDFGAGPRIVDVTTGETFKTWVFVMTLCWSRHQYAEVVVPARLIIDNPKCAITRACHTDPAVQRAYAACAEGYGFKIDACPPRDPQKKGIVESGVKYLKRAWMPLRSFRDLADANRQLHDWLLASAGTRCHGTTRCQPLERFTTTERGLLGRLPDVPPELATWA